MAKKTTKKKNTLFDLKLTAAFFFIIGLCLFIIVGVPFLFAYADRPFILMKRLEDVSTQIEAYREKTGLLPEDLRFLKNDQACLGIFCRQIKYKKTNDEYRLAVKAGGGYVVACKPTGCSYPSEEMYQNKSTEYFPPPDLWPDL